MSQYELTFLTEKEEDAKTVSDLMSGLKVKITKENNWGKKALAYRIKKHHSLYYFNWQFDLTPDLLPELNKKLNFNEKIIRYLLLKLN